MSSPSQPSSRAFAAAASSAGLRERVLGAAQHEAVRGADRVAGERQALDQQLGASLHQVLVDEGAGVALVAVGDDELLLALRGAREPPLERRRGSRRRRVRARSAALTSSSSCSGVCSASARARPTSRRACGSAPARRAATRHSGSPAGCVAPASTRATTSGPASITSPSRTAGEAWQKPRQTVSASETRAVGAALAHLQRRARRAARRRARRRSPRSRPCRCRRARGARRAAAAGRRRRSRRRRPPPRAARSARRRARRSSSVISPWSSIASFSTSSAVGASSA